MDRRNRLRLPRHEPLTDLTVQYVQRIVEPEESLFPRYCRAGRPPISATRAYQIVREVSERAGFHKYDEDGNVINEHVCPHFFRSARASQLANEYAFRKFELKRLFSWRTDRMASKYAKLSAGKLMDQMKPELMELPADFNRHEIELTP